MSFIRLTVPDMLDVFLELCRGLFVQGTTDRQTRANDNNPNNTSLPIFKKTYITVTSHVTRK